MSRCYFPTSAKNLNETHFRYDSAVYVFFARFGSFVVARRLVAGMISFFAPKTERFGDICDKSSPSPFGFWCSPTSRHTPLSAGQVRFRDDGGGDEVRDCDLLCMKCVFVYAPFGRSSAPRNAVRQRSSVG